MASLLIPCDREAIFILCSYVYGVWEVMFSDAKNPVAIHMLIVKK